jgi:hypothetical protein
MREHTSLDRILGELEANRYTVSDLRRYRLPVAYLLAGNSEKALRTVGQELDAMEGRGDTAALQYREFAEALQKKSRLNRTLRARVCPRREDRVMTWPHTWGFKRAV